MASHHRIKNIYYMLAYVYDKLLIKDPQWLASENFEHLDDLFAVVLEKMVGKLVKRGLQQHYVTQVEPLAGLRGQIRVEQSIKQQTFIMGRLVCAYDEFTEDIPFNQILKSTMLLLLRSDADTKYKKKLRKLLLYFNHISNIEPKQIRWDALHYHRNNSSYQMLMDFCRLIIETQLLAEERGTRKINAPISEDKLHAIFEKFVLAYYHVHHSCLNPRSDIIRWCIEEGELGHLLPQMKTDIMLSNQHHTLIIDTKFYQKNMSKSPHGEKFTYLSFHLYQIYAYVKNYYKVTVDNVSGVLLYAHLSDMETPSQMYNMNGNMIGVKVLNLDKEWSDIVVQLDSIAKEFFG
ncbi:5-methylcytosine restriction system specificity protein McrC [Entomospira culicis]|uniref:5-methylcytosine-specific restriction endonuclease system specificity protein McrC n=1 Tax=Entomospira culicis TaxID=2719989 RepID=A0A968KWS3_9SPIO|nr:5-methylcytosine-specific restriction endonuclease system specificity protein McrC [Entomospira culicis]NIZ19518.1 5-methylcytosine-specific restriction endonuclease system specificity protein McrC [Entomospira culicis]NIZ69577.1 5-methylcytosine-specific restriction endonuclease system specificity protein McrC [Entomospira culicis]WDI36688.1 hypothetical protein PVA46_05020 [Entomospira culicis]WDI38317.1 hypothetical protein PVA47_05030 [Entomospira culicis]